MGTVISNDGTVIAFDRYGEGPPVVLASGTLDSLANEGLAALLAERFTVINYYRRGHGESGDTQPWAIEREVEDLGAVIAETGGSASVFGSSGNGKFALAAAARGLGGKAASGAGRIEKLAVWEPPYIVDDSRPPVPQDYEDRLAGLLSEGKRGDMVELFMTEAVGMPAEAVAPIRETPFFGVMETVAHTLVYDTAISGDFSIPTGRMASITIPTLVVDGGEASWPWMRHGVQTLAGVLPNAQHRTLEGQPHNVDPAALAPVLAGFFAD